MTASLSTCQLDLILQLAVLLSHTQSYSVLGGWVAINAVYILSMSVETVYVSL